MMHGQKNLKKSMGLSEPSHTTRHCVLHTNLRSLNCCN